MNFQPGTNECLQVRHCQLAVFPTREREPRYFLLLVEIIRCTSCKVEV